MEEPSQIRRLVHHQVREARARTAVGTERRERERALVLPHPSERNLDARDLLVGEVVALDVESDSDVGPAS